ncbi:hypothetical protein QUB68_06740 [Microcoleus sp. A006_D1]|uniref:hypothetical protein n=1 Tax=Microcoleus sp. A006_D1 TaxID=3055267 RepID=UPI002FD09519
MNYKNRKKNGNKWRRLILLPSLLLMSAIIFTFGSSLMANVDSYCSPAIVAPVAALTPKNQKIVEIRAGGTTVINKKPFFPFGFYHVSWESTAEERKSALRDIAAAGFNTIHASATNIDDYGDFLDEAERLGVYVLTEQNSIGLQNLVNAFKQKPAVLGWSIADDVDNGKWNGDDILKSHQQAKTVDPNHITYVSGYSNKLKGFANCSDVIARQSYPIKGRKPEELPATYSDISEVWEATSKFNRSTYANLQTYNWQFHPSQKYEGSQAPTFEEVRNMTYQALLAGSKGILYYTYHDSAWHLPNHPDLWEGVKSLVPELKVISPLLLEGDFQKIDTKMSNIVAGIWVGEDQAVAVVVNSNYGKSREVSLELPIEVREARSMFQGRPSGMSLKGGKLFGSLKPLEVHVYRLAIGSGLTQTSVTPNPDL